MAFTAASDPIYTWQQVLRDKWWLGLLAFAVSLLATPLVRYVAYRKKIVDRPDDLLKPHGRPIAYLGGVAMCVGVLAGLIGYIAIMPDTAENWRRMGACLSAGDLQELLANPLWNTIFVVLALILITLVGLWDDVREISPLKKVLGQLLAAMLLVIGGVATQAALIFLSPLGIEPAPWLLWTLGMGMSFMIVISCCNATNLLDGLDGLCGGVSAIIGLGFLALTVWLAMWGNIHNTALDGLRVSLCLATVGAILGFLPYNTHPATIFMGDAGSMLLGFLFATLMILFCQEGTIRWFAASLVVFGVPIMDTSLAVVRRLLAGRGIFYGDRSHLYDQLIDRGMKLRSVVGLFYLLSAAAAVTGVVLAILLRFRYALILYAAMFSAMWVIFHRKGFIRERRPDAEPAERLNGDRKADLRLLFTSAGRRVSLLEQFRRAAREMGIVLEIHAADCQAIAPALQRADQVHVVPPIRSPQYVQQLLEVCRTERIDALIPLIDTDLPVLAGRHEAFAEFGTELVLSREPVISIASDKYETERFLRENGFLTPRILPEEELAGSPGLPLFMKPRHGSAAIGARRIDTLEELHFFHERFNDDVVQEFIHGHEYTVDVFADLHGRPLCAVPRRRHEIRGGEVSKSQAVRHAGIIRHSLRLIETLGACRGMITVQCFLTPDGQIVFIEINPRFGGGVPLSIAAGADSPRWLMELLLGRQPQVDPDAWQDGLYMLRYDQGIFVSPRDLPTAAE